MRRSNQKFQQYDLIQMAENIPWIHKGDKVIAFHDWSSKQGVVVGSYYDQFGGGKRERKIYTVLFEDRGECSWCDEPDMKLIEEGRTDLYEEWNLK